MENVRPLDIVGDLMSAVSAKRLKYIQLARFYGLKPAILRRILLWDGPHLGRDHKIKNYLLGVSTELQAVCPEITN